MRRAELPAKRIRRQELRGLGRLWAQAVDEELKALAAIGAVALWANLGELTPLNAPIEVLFFLREGLDPPEAKTLALATQLKEDVR